MAGAALDAAETNMSAKGSIPLTHINGMSPSDKPRAVRHPRPLPARFQPQRVILRTALAMNYVDSRTWAGLRYDHRRPFLGSSGA